MNAIQSKEVVLSERDNLFIEALLDTGGKIRESARIAGFNQDYGYAVYKRLAKYIAEAAQEYLAMHSIQAARVTIDQMEAEVPNPVRLAAAQAVLDRAGVTRQNFQAKEEGPVIKANIFILPEKRALPIMEIEYERA